MKLFYQKKCDFTCMVMALANVYSYLNRPFNNKFYEWVKQAKKDCKHGSYLNYREAIKYLELPLKKVHDERKIIKKGGIITIMHPIYNLHAIFVYPLNFQKGSFVAINSWLGPRKCILYYNDLKKFWKPERGSFALIKSSTPG